MSSASRFTKKSRILIVGCGDIGMRVAKHLMLKQGKAFQIFALTSKKQRFAELRAAGMKPILGDLDQVDSLWRIASIASTVIHLAPPQNSGSHDQRTRNLIQILSQAPHSLRKLVYISTTGVYGDHQGGWVNETTPVQPLSDRAKRRVDAEQSVRLFGATQGVSISILRVPGIYAADRLPLERIRSQTPAVLASEDSYSNHIHADDLARLVCASMYFGKPQRVINACDGGDLKMGDYFDLVADNFKLQRVPRLPRKEVKELVNPMLWSFMNESRRISNQRLDELKTPLHYPSVLDFFKKIQR
jgi:nucleoside-diphosphate-sugar epimerase